VADGWRLDLLPSTFMPITERRAVAYKFLDFFNCMYSEDETVDPHLLRLPAMQLSEGQPIYAI